MSDWLHNLSLLWMTIVLFSASYLITAAVYMAVVLLARGRRGRALKAVSPGLLSPLGVVFGLFVVFTAIQVWNDNDHAKAAVDYEATSLKSVVVLADGLPEESRRRLCALVANHIQEVVGNEWTMMANQGATLSMTPQYLDQGLKLTLAQTPETPGGNIAQKEIVTALGHAFDARRQRILVSRVHVSSLKWLCLLIQAACVLFAIGLIHCDDHFTCAISMGLFTTGVAACLVLIVAYDRPLIGQFGVRPEPLLQVLQEASKIAGTAPPNMHGKHP